MAIGGFRKFLTTFSSIFTLAALALVVFAIVGPVKKSALDTIHFIRFDLSNINLASIASDSGIAETLANAAESITFSAEDFGFSNTYIFTAWGYCESNGTGASASMKYCTSPEALYYLDPQTFLQEQLDSNAYSSVVTELIGSDQPIQITLPSEISTYTNTIEAVSKLIFICGFIAIGALALNFINNYFAKRSHILSCGSFLLSFIGSVALLLTAAASTGMWVLVETKFNKELESTGAKAHIDPVYYGLIWGALGAGFCSTIGWMFAICCGSTNVEDYEDYKE
ncbi:Pun1 protein [Saccharomycopsis crataegensis]|uniref:Pun1 protein n=1 Tax=Saccharomycopsis crataegensis TaxID=43959 RepID=A0AAV5QVR6_9ASCO|nr:Pun1 protein [Saccharomycopsis crataegensis]